MRGGGGNTEVRTCPGSKVTYDNDNDANDDEKDGVLCASVIVCWNMEYCPLRFCPLPLICWVERFPLWSTVVMLLQTGPREDAAGRNLTKKMETR